MNQVDEYVCSVLIEFVLKQLDCLDLTYETEILKRASRRLSAQLRLICWYTVNNGYLWVD